MMKKILFLLLITSLITACENQEVDFPDFDYNAVYFPIQYPVRTLSLGNDVIDNSLDRELKFHIGVSIGGMYENNENWTVEYVVDESLCEGLANDVQPLPSSWYTLEPQDQVTIPAGSFTGLIQVQLEEAFLFDSLSTGNNYVIPLRITRSNADSILTGAPTTSDPDKLVKADWEADAPPKDFTLFMVKYVNEYHGYYLKRGVDYGQDAFGNYTDTATYHEKYVEQDEVVSLETVSRYAIETGYIGANSGEEYAFKIVVDPSTGEATVETVDDSRYKIIGTGTGEYVPNGDSWGGEERDVFYLHYKYRVGLYGHEVFDTLVFRNRGIAYEEFVPVKQSEEK